MLYVQVSKILDRAAFFLNDVNRSYFTNSVLMNPFMVAYDDLREFLVDNNISLMNETTAAYDISTSQTDIGGPTGPPLPTDFMAPYAVWEKLKGSNDDYTIMEPKNFLPKTETLVPALRYWQYSNQYIKFIGATTDRNVKIDYIANNLLVAEDPEAMVSAFNCQSFLAYRTAALAAKYLGENESRSAELNADAGRSIENIVNMDVKSKQNIITRRRPFNQSYRNSGILGF